MTVDKIILTPHARLVFTKDDVDVLTKCSASHYDFKCKAAGESGLVSMLRNQLGDGPDATAELGLSISDVDLFMKICESPPYLMAYKSEVALAWRLQREQLIVQLMEVFKQLNDEYRARNLE